MKNIISLFILLSFFISLYAQKNDYHWYEKDGKIYYNKNVPVYFWVSTNPDNNEDDILLSSQRSKRFVNPMYFDTEGFNTFQSFDVTDSLQRRKHHATFKIYADGYPPETKIKFHGRRKYVNGKFIYHTGMKIELSAIDYISGVDKIYYSINNSDFKEYNTQITFDTEGKYEFSFYAIDNTGNKSRIRTYRFSIE